MPNDKPVVTVKNDPVFVATHKKDTVAVQIQNKPPLEVKITNPTNAIAVTYDSGSLIPTNLFIPMRKFSWSGMQDIKLVYHATVGAWAGFADDAKPEPFGEKNQIWIPVAFAGGHWTPLNLPILRNRKR